MVDEVQADQSRTDVGEIRMNVGAPFVMNTQAATVVGSQERALADQPNLARTFAAFKSAPGKARVVGVGRAHNNRERDALPSYSHMTFRAGLP
jgi:hypothetical protein